MTSHFLARTAFFVASKRLGGVCVDDRSAVFKHGHEDNRRIPGAGKLRQTTNALGHSTFHEYDLQGREVYTWGPATYPTVQGYNIYGQRNLLRTFRDTNADFSTSLFPTTATGDTTTWIYDDATGVLLQKTYADGKGPTYTYYADCLLNTRTWARKDANNSPLTTTYVYNAQGNLINIDYSDLTSDVTYTYNTLGQQITVTDGTGTLNFTYDPTTRALTQEVYTGTLNATLSRAYDHYTRPTGYALVDSTGAAITTAATYTYDTTGNFAQVQSDTIPSQLTTSLSGANPTNLTPNTFTYNRLANSDLISTVTGPVHTVTNTYEPNRDVLTTKQNRVTTGPNANSIVSQYDYTVNSIGQRATRTQSGTAFDGIGYAPATQLPPTMTGTLGSGTTTDTFSYNSRGEVVASTNNQLLSQNRSYSYDPIGNRLATTEGDLNTPTTNPSAKTYTSNALNQYTQINTTVPTPPATVQPTYDDDGNLLTDGTGKTYTWDCENRLIQVTLPNNEIVHYAYDATSRRIQRQYLTPTNTTTTTYHYDAWNVIHEYTTNSTPTENTPATSTTTHHWGLDLSNTLQGAGGVGGLLSSKYISGETIQCHSHTYDGNGNVSELLGEGGITQTHYEYDAFGKETVIAGVISRQNAYRFSTKPWDDETGLSYYGYRFYQPRDGRWLNRDMLDEQGGLNLYGMNMNNSINGHDFLGLIHKAKGSCSDDKCCSENLLKILDILEEIADRLEHDLSEDFYQKAIDNAPRGKGTKTFRESWNGHIQQIIEKITGLENCLKVLLSQAASGKCGTPPPDFSSIEQGIKDLLKSRKQLEDLKFPKIISIPSPTPTPIPRPTPVPQPVPGGSPWWKPIALVGAVTLLAVAVASPFEGPAGDVAAACLCASVAAM